MRQDHSAEAGTCRQCPLPPVLGKRVCFYHWAWQSAWAKAVRSEFPQHDGPLAFLIGAMEGWCWNVRNGYRPPAHYEDAYRRLQAVAADSPMVAPLVKHPHLGPRITRAAVRLEREAAKARHRALAEKYKTVGVYIAPKHRSAG